MLALAALPLSQPPLVVSGTVRLGAGEAHPYTIHRLPPSSFPELPAPLAAQMAARGCMVPQSYQAHRPENVIMGSFSSPGSRDWAALCSHDGVTDLLVYFSGSASGAAEGLQTVATHRDLERLAPVSARPGAGLGFGWAIDPAPPERMGHARTRPGIDPGPGRIGYDHAGIEEIRLNEGSSFDYWDGDRWLSLAGDNLEED
jgi:hypothetical protein